MSARFTHSRTLSARICPGLLQTIGHLGFCIGQCQRFSPTGTALPRNNNMAVFDQTTNILRDCFIELLVMMVPKKS